MSTLAGIAQTHGTSFDSDNCRVEHRSMGSYVRFMHRCRARRLVKYRRQPHINSGHDSDQRQLVKSVLRTTDADLSVSRRIFLEEIPKGRGYFVCVSEQLVKTSSKERSDIVSQVCYVLATDCRYLIASPNCETA